MDGGDDLPDEEELEARACELFRRWGVLEKLAHVEVVWNSRLRTTAGRAFMKRLQIQLNPRLLSRVPDRIDEVLAHEAAHLATFLVHGRRARPHGPEWGALMQAAGHSPAATHDFPIEGLQPRRSYFLHLCTACGAREIQDTAQRRTGCSCPPANQRIFRAPRNERGLAALHRLDAQSGQFSP